MNKAIIILKAFTLPFHLLVGIIAGVLGMGVYWYYWTFKPNELYKRYGDK